MAKDRPPSLKERFNQPIDKPHRRLALALIALLLISVVVLNVVAFPTPSPAPETTAPSGPPVTPRPAAPADPPAAATADDVAMTAKALRSSERAARRFLRGYLPYVYGQAPVSRITGATSQLLAALKAEPVRIPPGTKLRSLTPRIDVMTAGEDLTPTRVSWSALINDGKRDPYTVPVTTEFVGGEWLVTHV